MEVTSGTGFSLNITSILLQIMNTFSVLLAVAIVVFVVMLFLNKLISKLIFVQALKRTSISDKSFLFIRIPPSSEQKIVAMDEFLKSLHHCLPKNSYLSLEIISINQFLRFFLIVDKDQKNVIESQLYAQYPQAEAEEVEDPMPIFSENTAFAQIDFKRKSVNPLSTYKNLEEDFLKNLSAILSKTDPGEEVYIQLTLKKIGSGIMERGKGLLLNKLSSQTNSEGNLKPSAYKLSQDLYQGKLRIAFVAKDKDISISKLDTLAGLFKSVKSPYNELKTKKELSADFSKIFRARLFEKGDYWTTSEASTIYHFPYKESVISNVVNTISKRAPAPDILPKMGLVDSTEVSFFAETNYRNEKKVFGIKRFDRRRHLYVIGKSGTGKSRLLELLLISDIQGGHGCCLLDPHGDLADELLMFVPKERINDVVYINPADKDYPIGFNPLEPVNDFEMRQHLSTFFIAIFKKLFAASWNQRMEHLIRYITLALLETPDSNILGIPRILSDTAFRQRVVKQIQDPVVKAFWTTEFAAWNEQFANEAVVPILNKVGQFIANPVVRNVVGQRKNNLDFEKFMNEGKIVIINISKGKLGDDNTALLGSMFITKIQQAALSRSKIKEEERRDFFFYVDEFQNFATDAFSTILSEARKYRLNLTIAHQYIAQLPEDVKATAFGNVGSIVAFAVGGDDAAYLGKEFAPTFSPEDLITLNSREMYIKMSIDGKITPPFSAKTIDVPKPATDYSTDIFNHSRLTYGTNRIAVENEIARWSSSADLVDDRGNEREGFPEPII